MNSKLFIRNLAYSTTEDELLTLFTLSGTVITVEIMKDRVSGRSKGYGFIQMSNLAEAERAVEMFNGWSLDNHELHVGLTRHRERRDNLLDYAATNSSRADLPGDRRPFYHG
jgi:RNA recognition motif-containing protein